MDLVSVVKDLPVTANVHPLDILLWLFFSDALNLRVEHLEHLTCSEQGPHRGLVGFQIFVNI